MKKLKLPPGRFFSNGNITTILLDEHHIALIDTEDLPKVVSYNWHYAQHKNKGYAITDGKVNGKRITLRLHRVVLNALPKEIIDHEDHNGLNCRKHNLRRCTPKQNAENRSGANENSKTGLRGISQAKCGLNESWKSK